MSVNYAGSIHDAALGFDEMWGVDEPSVQGDYRGQEVKLNPKSKSLIEEADQMDDYVVARREETAKLKDRKIEDKKKVSGKNKLLHQFVRRLDKQQGSRQYQDYEARLRRLKQRMLIQMMDSDANTEQDSCADMVLEGTAESFDGVTEQDNALEYMEALQDFEAENAEAEMRQAEKMLKRLEGRTDKRGLGRQKDFQDKIEDLSAQVKLSKLFKRELTAAKETLRHAHGQEIKDGYNLIPKATDLFASLTEQRTRDFGNTEARMVSDVYQQALCADSLVGVMDATFNSFGAKNIKVGLNAVLELSGIDIQSANPSRDVPYLVSVRETLFKTEISSQLYDAVGKLRKDIASNFDECAEKTFGESEQYAVTKSIAKLSQQSFVGSEQMREILELLGVD